MSISTTSHRDVQTNTFVIEHKIVDKFLSGDDMCEAIIRNAGAKVADHIIANYLPEILEKISPDAIANMAIAEAAAAVNQTLKQKMPDKIVEIVRRESPQVYQKGLLGGLKRIS